MGHLELTVFHFLYNQECQQDIHNSFCGTGSHVPLQSCYRYRQELKYREWNGRSNRYVIHLTCSRQSLKCNFVVFDVLKYFDLTKSEFFFDILYYACFVLRGVVTPHYATHKLEECLPSFN